MTDVGAVRGRNLKRLAARQPNLTRSIEAAAAEASRYTVEVARSGEATLRLGDRHLASAYNPGAEGARAAGAVPAGATEPVLVLGAGVFRHVEAVLARARGPVVVAEPDPALLCAVLGLRDLPCLDDPRLSIVSPADPILVAAAVRSVFDAARDRTVHLVIGPSMRGVDSAAARAALERLADEVPADRLRDRLSRLAQAPSWFGNVLRNLPRLAGAASGLGLDGAAAGLPAFVVGAGPSLSRNAGRLADVGDSGVVIAVDTALRALEGAGVAPHVVIAVDANAANDSDLDGLPPSFLAGSLLVVDPIVSPGIPSRHPGPLAVSRTENYLLDADGTPRPEPDAVTDLAEALLGALGRWQSGGSVATNAFDLAARMGCDPIVLVGLDLAYTGGLPHAPGTGPEEAAALAAGRFATRETLARGLRRSHARRRVAAQGGGEVETDAVLDSYRRWLEDTVAFSYKGRRTVLDATEGGAVKRGIGAVTLAEAIRAHTRPGGGAGRRLAAALGRRLADRAEVARRLADRIASWGRDGAPVPGLAGLAARVLDELRGGGA